MKDLRFLSKGEQFAEYLRGKLEEGHWVGEMPGRPELEAEFGVNKKTVEDAFRVLELSGHLVAQGTGRRRKIVELDPAGLTRGLKVRILSYEKGDRSLPDQVELQLRLREAGHDVSFARESLQSLDMDAKRVGRFVKNEPADAWVISAATREILEWFVAENIPVFAQYGRFSDVPVAGMAVRKIPAMQKAVEQLVSMGHRRIVLIAREERRKPAPGLFERTFLETLQQHGIATGSYHLPDWQESIPGFHASLDRLFQLTPPTAMLICEAPLFSAAHLHLARRGILAPRDVSLICDDPDSSFTWCMPAISHINWSARPIINRIVRWVENLSQGIDDREQGHTVAKFIEGETIGQAPLRGA